MNTRNLWKQVSSLRIVIAASMLPVAVAQVAPTSPATDPKQDESVKLEKFVVTGSLIKRLESEGALPVQIIMPLEMEQQGIVSVEQMIMDLNINGNAMDNLASNADVVAGQQRGNNGATSANLRMQGANATLILLNGRRVASHGLNGGVVDLNSIPFAAVQRVEVLKDGASATYGTDAVGGVINFILKNNYQGFSTSAAADVTEEGGGNIFRYSAVGGFGDLNKQHFNIMQSFSHSDSKRLRGDQRKWNGTFFPDRGLSPDTTGAPIAQVQPVSTLYSIISRDNINATGRGTGPVDPTNPAINLTRLSIVGLPGGPTYDSLGTGIYQEIPYDIRLWPSNKAFHYGSAWDTARAAVLQQPVRNTNSVTRGVYKIGEHRVTGEFLFGRSASNKSFSPNQVTTSTGATTTAPDGVTAVPNPFFNMAYPSTGPDYNRVFNILANAFPSLAANRGLPIPIRWRAMPFGNREIHTQTDTWRGMVSLEGPVPFATGWDYRAGVSRASSKGFSVLNHGYFYTRPFVDLINNGIVDPFAIDQTPEAIAGIDKARADGVKLYGGRSTTDEADFSASGPLFKLPAGMIQAGVGVDHRVEKYAFAGDSRKVLNTIDTLIFNAPFDNGLATNGPLKRNVDAIFAEFQVPLLRHLDFTAAGRVDRYTGFGSTKNPKFQLRYAPSEKLLFRSAYSTGFRVPTFKQVFDPRYESPYAGNDFKDPETGQFVPANSASTIFGGNPTLQPEKAKMYSAGTVFQPFGHFSGNLDWWSIKRTGTIQSFAFSDLLANYNLFKDRFIRNAAGQIIKVDTSYINAGATEAQGVELGLKADADVAEGKLYANFDVSYLIKKRQKLLATAPWGPEEINQFTRSSDLGLRWKHTATLSYRKGNWTGSLHETFRNSYIDAVLPGVADKSFVPPNWHPRVKQYDVYGLSLTYRGIKNTTVIAGVKNLFNTRPPFSATYDTNTGAGSDWESRVADPRDRSYTLRIDYKFW